MSDKCVLCGKKIKTRYMLTKLTYEDTLWAYGVYMQGVYSSTPSVREETVLLPICEECLKKRLGDIIVVEKL